MKDVCTDVWYQAVCYSGNMMLPTSELLVHIYIAKSARLQEKEEVGGGGVEEMEGRKVRMMG